MREAWPLVPVMPRSAEDERRAMRGDLRDAIIDTLPLGLGALALVLYLLATTTHPALALTACGGGILGWWRALSAERCPRRTNGPPMWGGRSARNRPLSPYEVRLFARLARYQRAAALKFALLPLCIALVATLLIFPRQIPPPPLLGTGRWFYADLIAFALGGLLLNVAIAALAGFHTYQTTRSLRYYLARRDLALDSGDQSVKIGGGDRG